MQDNVLLSTNKERAIYHLILRKTKLLIDLFYAEEIKFDVHLFPTEKY